MSLLDDVSIVVTPNGYKARTLYGVIPVPSEGAEQVVNGDFATDTDWTIGGTTFSAGAILLDDANDNVFQGWTDTVNTLYKLTITKTGLGTLRFRSGFAGSAATKIEIPESGIIYFTSTSDTNRIQIYGDENSINATLNSVSVKEYTAADMDVTRATAATRVDENGLVNYAEVLGGEEITNGDFATNLDSWSTSSWWVWNSLGAYHPSTSSHKPLYQQCCVIGKTYLITFDLNCVGSSQAKFSLGSSTGSTTQVIGTSLTTGSYSYFVTAAAEYIVFNRQNTAEYYVNNVSVKEAARDNVPRIDYTGGGCPHILAEPQRTNNLTASQDLTNLFWNSISTETIVASTVLSPDGTTFGFKAIPSASSGNTTHYIDYDFGHLSMPSGAELTYSIFVKPFGYTNFQLATSTSFASKYQNFELTGGGVVRTGDVNGAKIEKIGEWYRCSITETLLGTTPRVLNIALPSSGLGRNPSFVGNSTDGVLLWGGQIEEGAYGTSYIPNLSTTSGSTVTRNQDIFTRDGIGSLINSTEGVLFVEMAALADDGVAKYLTMNDGSSNNDVRIYFNTASNGISALLKSTTGATQAFLSYTVTDTTAFHKIAFVYAVNRFELWVDGEKRAEDLSGIAPVGLTTLEFSRASNFLPLFAKVKQLQVYNTALTDEQLLQLTGESGTDFYESYAAMATALTYTIQ